MTDWRQFRRGKPELKAGAVLFGVAAAGLMLLLLWDSTAEPLDPATVFTAHGFASTVSAIMLVGMLTVGVVLLLLGTFLWLIQRLTGRD